MFFKITIRPSLSASFLSLPPNVLLRIQSYWTLRDIRRLLCLGSLIDPLLGLTSGYRVPISGYTSIMPSRPSSCHSRIIALFTKYFPGKDEAADFRELLSSCRAIVTGAEVALVLQSFRPTSLNVLDVRCMFDEHARLRFLFQRCGYRQHSTSPHEGYLFFNEHLKTAIRLFIVNDTLRYGWALAGLTTADLNWIDADAIRCPFPSLSFNNMFAMSSPLLRNLSGMDAIAGYRPWRVIGMRRVRGAGGWIDWHGQGGISFPDLNARMDNAWCMYY